MHFLRRAGLATAFLSLILLASASEGDNNSQHPACVAECQTQQCATGQFEATIPFSLWLTRWTCTDNCKYNCMHQAVGEMIQHGKKPPQYYGKWPFWRFAGLQEPASVLFSVLNFVAHFLGYFKVDRTLPSWHPMKPFYKLWALISMNAWLWSSVFHARDKPLTEKLDYFSAALAILSALYGVTLRVFHLYPQPPQNKLASTSHSTKLPPWKTLAGICAIAYAGHIYYLTSGPRFHYMYNTIFNCVLGLIHNLLWTLYALPSSLSVLKSRFPNSSKTYRPPFVNKVGFFVLVTTLATTLELLDFAPWQRTIDAHSLWHAVTAPIGYCWYAVLIEDALDPSWKGPLLRQRPE